MPQTYVKECDFCKEKIRMSDQRDGKWHAFNSDGKLHDCRGQQQLQFNQNDVITLEQVLKRLKLVGVDLDIKKLLMENEV